MKPYIWKKTKDKMRAIMVALIGTILLGGIMVALIGTTLLGGIMVALIGTILLGGIMMALIGPIFLVLPTVPYKKGQLRTQDITKKNVVLLSY